MPSASIIIPTYNRAKFIGETVQSVLSQTFRDLEVIIVDDGSTDETKDLVAKIIKKDSRVKYFYQTNCGRPSVPRNVGLNHSQGKYLAFLDSDDIWQPEKLSKQIDIFAKDKAGKIGFVDCGHLIIDENGKEIKNCYIGHNKKGEVFQELLKNNFILTPGSILMRKDVLSSVGGFDEFFNCMDDWDMWLRISKNYYFEFVNENLFKYRVHKNSITVDLPQKKKRREVLHIFEKHKEDYLKYYPKEIKEIAVFYCEEGDIKNGRKFLREAIKLNSRDYKIYFHYVLSFFGSSFYNFFLLILRPLFRLIKKQPDGRRDLRNEIFKNILNVEI